MLRMKGMYNEVWVTDESYISVTHQSYEPNKLTCSQLSGFIAELEEHCTRIAEVVVPNPVEATWILQVSIK